MPPANVTGNATAGESPSPDPDAGTAPISTVPVSGDPVTAASVRQALGNPIDHLAFEKAPFAKAGAWALPVKPFRNARLQTRFFVDHGGLPGGRFYRFTEMWTPSTPFNLGPGFSQAGLWTYQGSGSAGGTSPQPPGAGTFNPSNAARNLNLNLDGTSSGNRGQINLTDPTACFTDDNYVAVDFDFAIRTILNTDWVIGLCSGELIDAIAQGAFIILPAGLAVTYKARTINGGSPTEVDTGVAGTAGVPHHLRIEWWGANVADDSAAHAIFYIDGALVANITTTLPNSGTHLIVPIFGGFTVGSGTANLTMFMGPISYTQITAI